ATAVLSIRCDSGIGAGPSHSAHGRTSTAPAKGLEMAHSTALQMFDEMKEFATFTAASQRYIRRSIDVGLGRDGAAERWARDAGEAASIAAQMRAYRKLATVRDSIPEDDAPESAEKLMGALISPSAFDLAEGRLESF